MKNNRIPIETKITHLSSNVFHFWFNRDIDNFVKLLSPSFVWIGSYESQYTHGIEQFLEITKQERTEAPANVYDEEYYVVSHDKNSWVVCGTFSASAWTDETTYLTTRQRATFIWKKIDNEIKLIHLHCTMARDVPLENDNNVGGVSKENLRWYKYMQYAEKHSNLPTQKKHFFKDINGNIYYVSPSEILCIEMNYRVATIYCENRKIEIRKSLNQLMEEFPFFLQPHKSWLANPVYIVNIKRYSLTLIHNIEVPIGKSKYNELKEQLKSIS